MVWLPCMPVVLTYISIFILHVRCDDIRFGSCTEADTTKIKVAISDAQDFVSRSVRRLQEIEPILQDAPRDWEAVDALLEPLSNDDNSITLAQSTALTYQKFIDSNVRAAMGGGEVVQGVLNLFDKTMEAVDQLGQVLQNFLDPSMTPVMQFQCKQWLTPAGNIPPNAPSGMLYFIDLRASDAGRTPVSVDGGLVVLPRNQGNMVLSPPQSPMFGIDGLKSGPRFVINFDPTAPTAHLWASHEHLFNEDFGQDTVTLATMQYSSMGPLLLFLLSQSSIFRSRVATPPELDLSDENIYRYDPSRKAEIQNDVIRRTQVDTAWKMRAEMALVSQYLDVRNLELLILALGFDHFDWSRLRNYYRITSRGA